VNEEVTDIAAEGEDEEVTYILAVDDEQEHPSDPGWDDLDPEQISLAEWLEILEDPDGFPPGLLENMPDRIKDFLAEHAVDPGEEVSE
jgi:hypothetical protein